MYINGSSLPFIPASHEDKNTPGVLKKVLLDSSEELAGRVMMVNWARLPAGSSFQNHFHEDMTEVFIMVHGDQVRMTVGENIYTMSVGDCVKVPPKTPHQMRNESAEDVLYVVFGVSSEEGGKTVVCPPTS